MTLQKTSLIIEGKTKKVWATDDPNLVVFEMKDRLSAGDGIRKDEVTGIGALKAAQIANLFGFLNGHGIGTAFHEKISDTELVCDACEMIPLELVVRRMAWGSALQRQPELKQADGTPFRFETPLTEIYLKDSVVVYPDGTAELMDEPSAVKLRDAGKADVYTDPIVVPREDGTWGLFNAHAPVVGAPLIAVEPTLPMDELKPLFDDIVLPAFLALERGWAETLVDGESVTLVDFKVEIGRRKSDGKLVLSDELNADSMRLWPAGDPTKQIDKQIYREGATIEATLARYEQIAGLTGAMAA